MTLSQKAQRLIEEFAVYHDPHERLTAIVDRARRVPALPPGQRIAAHRVPGCVSVVWLGAVIRDGVCHFHADAESPMVRALVVMVADFYSGVSPQEIVASSVDPMALLGLTQNLSPTRRNGLASTRAAIQAFALAQVESSRK